MGSYFSKLYRSSGSANISRSPTNKSDSPDSVGKSNYQEGNNNFNKDLTNKCNDGKEGNVEIEDTKLESLEESVNSSAAAWRDQIEVDPSFSLAESKDAVEVESKLSFMNADKLAVVAPEKLEENSALGEPEVQHIEKEKHAFTELDINHKELKISLSGTNKDKLCDTPHDSELIAEIVEPEQSELVPQSTESCDTFMTEKKLNNQETAVNESGNLINNEDAKEPSTIPIQGLVLEELPTHDNEKSIEAVQLKTDQVDIILNNFTPVQNDDIVLEEIREQIEQVNIKEKEFSESEKVDEIIENPVLIDSRVDETSKNQDADNEYGETESSRDITEVSDTNLEQFENEKIPTDSEMGVEIDVDKFVESTNSDHNNAIECHEIENFAQEENFCKGTASTDTFKSDTNENDVPKLSIADEKDAIEYTDESVANFPNCDVTKNEIPQSELSSEHKADVKQCGEIDVQSNMDQAKVDLTSPTECKIDCINNTDDQTPSIDEKGEQLKLEGKESIICHE